MEISDIQLQLTQYFEEHNGSKVTADTQLLEEKVIDSMGIMELIAYLESQYCLEFTDEDLTAENFKDMESIGKMIMTKKAGR